MACAPSSISIRQLCSADDVSHLSINHRPPTMQSATQVAIFTEVEINAQEEDYKQKWLLLKWSGHDKHWIYKPTQLWGCVQLTNECRPSVCQPPVNQNSLINNSINVVSIYQLTIWASAENDVTESSVFVSCTHTLTLTVTLTRARFYNEHCASTNSPKGRWDKSLGQRSSNAIQGQRPSIAHVGLGTKYRRSCSKRWN